MKREIVTPALVFIFLVVSVSGILMFFHLLDGYTNVVHEFLGLAFALFAILHIVINWKSIANYARKKQLLIPSVIVLMISITFIILGKINGNLEGDILEKLLKSPAHVSFRVLNTDYNKARAVLEQNNIVAGDSLQSIEEISIKNQKSPEEIVELIMR